MKQKLSRQSENISLVAVIVVLFIIFTILQPNMMTLFNIKNILVQVSLTAIAAAGMTFAYTAGVFDMSVGSILALISVVVAKVATTAGVVPAIGAAFLIAVVVGILNGLIVTKLGIQAFAATLVTMILIRGIAVLMADGADVPLYSVNAIKFISSGTILGIPFPIILTVLVYAASYFLYYKTEFGMKIRSVGSNGDASRISGIRTDRMITAAFVLTAVTAVFSSLIKTAQVMFGKATIGEDFALDVMTTVILGGTVITGGKGNLTGTLIASVLIAVIKNGLNINNVNSYYQQLAIGIILIFALVFNGMKSMKNARQIRREG
ncbi:MAG TPA: ABC transporter permease [Candidatus Ruminococcus avistercoris]|nr:ABC transporter permease [Candidatus Ruminococcus avistercoris]